MPFLTRDILICSCCIFHWMVCIATDTFTQIRRWFMQSNTNMFNTPSCNFPNTSHLPVWGSLGKWLVCHPPQPRPVKESRAGHGEMSVWLSSHNRRHLKPVEQMLGGGSERLTETRGHKSVIVSGSQASCYDKHTWQILLLTHLENLTTKTLGNSTSASRCSPKNTLI